VAFSQPIAYNSNSQSAGAFILSPSGKVMPRTVVPFIAWVGLLTLAALVSNCATPPPEPSEVVIALPGLPLTLMPHARSESLTSSYLSNMFEGLAGFDRDMKLVPLLAVSWRIPTPSPGCFGCAGG